MAGVQELERLLGALREARDEIGRRRDLVEKAGVVRGSRLAMPRLVLDAAGLDRWPASTLWSRLRERDAILAECWALVGTVTRLGRAVGVHLRWSSVHPSADPREPEG